jgi:predicted transcriptional regulator
MKSIVRRFNKINRNNPGLSTISCFAVAITDQNFSRQTIARGFNKLVDKNDYDKKDKKEIVAFYNRLTKKPEDNQKQTQPFILKVYSGKVDNLVVNQKQSL